MAVLYEIEKSGFADMLRSGIVITGGVAQCANICNFINDISGYKVRTGYPKHLFSHQGCEGLTDTSAATSMGLLLAAKNTANVNCIITNEEPETVVEVENLQTEENKAQPEDGKERDLWGNVIETTEVKETPKAGNKTTKPTPKPPKTPTWKTWMEDLFNSMDDNNV